MKWKVIKQEVRNIFPDMTEDQWKELADLIEIIASDAQAIISYGGMRHPLDMD